jgi:hypothetical protein
MAALSDPAERALRLYKIDFPSLTGPSIYGRGSRCNLFFLSQQMQDSDKMWLASYHLTDVATLW